MEAILSALADRGVVTTEITSYMDRNIGTLDDIKAALKTSLTVAEPMEQDDSCTKKRLESITTALRETFPDQNPDDMTENASRFKEVLESTIQYKIAEAIVRVIRDTFPSYTIPESTDVQTILRDAVNDSCNAYKQQLENVCVENEKKLRQSIKSETYQTVRNIVQNNVKDYAIPVADGEDIEMMLVKVLTRSPAIDMEVEISKAAVTVEKEVQTTEKTVEDTLREFVRNEFPNYPVVPENTDVLTALKGAIAHALNEYGNTLRRTIESETYQTVRTIVQNNIKDYDIPVADGGDIKTMLEEVLTRLPAIEMEVEGSKAEATDEKGVQATEETVEAILMEIVRNEFPNYPVVPENTDVLTALKGAI
ncbi:laminin subunit gamma-1, partial [Lasius niger]